MQQHNCLRLCYIIPWTYTTPFFEIFSNYVLAKFGKKEFDVTCTRKTLVGTPLKRERIDAVWKSVFIDTNIFRIYMTSIAFPFNIFHGSLLMVFLEHSFHSSDEKFQAFRLFYV